MPFFRVTDLDNEKPYVVNVDTVRYVCKGRHGQTVIVFDEDHMISVSEDMDTVIELMTRRTIEAERALEA